MLADSLLMLDQQLAGKLLVQSATASKEDLAAKEGKRMKRLTGALRHLFRNSASISTHGAFFEF